MMRSILFAACAAILSGCSVPSLNPLYSKDVMADDPGLEGAWGTDKGEVFAKVARTGPGEYTVAAALMGDDSDERPRPEVLTARLVKLGESTFIDLVLHEGQRSDLTRDHNFLAVRTYQVLKFKRDGDTLTVWGPEYDRYKSLLTSGEAKLSHAELADAAGGPDLVVTASTRDLQAFFKAHAGDEALFSNTAVFKRVK
jgi:hypothetical protein